MNAALADCVAHVTATLPAPFGAAAGTTAVTRVADTIVNVAATPLIATAVVPASPVPLMVTVAPAFADVGASEVIVGTTAKLDGAVTEPLTVVTTTGPAVAFVGTVAVICPLFTNRTDPDATPLKVTPLIPANPDPLIVTVVPTAPTAGVIDVTTGTTVNTGPVAVPVAVVNVTGPVVAHAGTVALYCVVLTNWIELDTAPLNAIDCTLAKPLPFTLTIVPVGDAVGETDVMTGVTA